MVYVKCITGRENDKIMKWTAICGK